MVHAPKKFHTLNSSGYFKNLSISGFTIKISVEELKKVSCLTQENNWVFIIRIKVYYKSKDIEEVTIISELDHYPER